MFIADHLDLDNISGAHPWVKLTLLFSPVIACLEHSIWGGALFFPINTGMSAQVILHMFCVSRYIVGNS